MIRGGRGSLIEGDREGGHLQRVIRWGSLIEGDRGGGGGGGGAGSLTEGDQGGGGHS